MKFVIYAYEPYHLTDIFYRTTQFPISEHMLQYTTPDLSYRPLNVAFLFGRFSGNHSPVRVSHIDVTVSSISLHDSVVFVNFPSACIGPNTRPRAPHSLLMALTKILSARQSTYLAIMK